MFTGLIEEQGKVLSLTRDGTNLFIEIQAAEVLSDLKLGDSIAVDGVCQTVTKITDTSFSVTAIDETLKLTNFDTYKEGTQVNLERCLRPTDRLGGHIVAGHVDCIGKIVAIEDCDGSQEFYIQIPQLQSKYIIYKGSIAVSGISLTVAGVSDKPDSSKPKLKEFSNAQSFVFSLAIIPKTLEITTLGNLKPGDLVNIELDQVAKYIEKFSAISS